MPTRCLSSFLSMHMGSLQLLCIRRRGTLANIRTHINAVESTVPTEKGLSHYRLRSEDIHLVDSLAALAAVEEHIFCLQDTTESPGSSPGRVAERILSAPEMTDTALAEPMQEAQNGDRMNKARDSSAACTQSDAAKPSSRSQEGNCVGQSHPHTYQIVGLDTEWQPSATFSAVSLLQISTRSRAYLIDMMYFCRPAPLGWSSKGMSLPQLTHEERALDKFLASLLGADTIVKAGFAFKGDLRNLCRSFPHLPCMGRNALTERTLKEGGSPQVRRYVDLKQLALHLWPDRDAVERAMGLAKLTALILGKGLDKTQQDDDRMAPHSHLPLIKSFNGVMISDWGRRPLTTEQRQYAGSDAHVLPALADRILMVAGQEGVESFPAELTESLDVGTAAKEARLWHRVKAATDTLPQEWSWEYLQRTLPEQKFDPSIPKDKQKLRYRQRTPRLPSKASAHGVNFGALQDFLGYTLPKPGRSVIMQIASASEDGKIPASIPQYSRGGGVVPWKNSVMLFVNAEASAPSKYANTFLEGGRKIVWFPSYGQTQHHPLIKRMLATDKKQHASAEQDAVILFCRKGISGRWLPFVYLGRLTQPKVDWGKGSSGTFEWTLQDYDTLLQRPAFLELVDILSSEPGELA